MPLLNPRISMMAAASCVEVMLAGQGAKMDKHILLGAARQGHLHGYMCLSTYLPAMMLGSAPGTAACAAHIQGCLQRHLFYTLCLFCLEQNSLDFPQLFISHRTKYSWRR